MVIYNGTVTFKYCCSAKDREELQMRLDNYDYGFMTDYEVDYETSREEALADLMNDERKINEEKHHIS